MNSIRSIVFFWGMFFIGWTVPASADPLDNLRDDVARIGAMFGADVGASIALDDGAPIALINGDKRYMFMSTVKLLVGIEILKLVEEGKLSMDQPIEVTQEDFTVMGPISRTLPKFPTVTPLQNLLWTMIVDSDNTAPNTLMRLMNGPKGVETFFNERGVIDLSVDHSIRELFIKGYQVENMEQFVALLAEKSKLPGGALAFLTSPLESPVIDSGVDTITPNAMVKIVSMLVRGQLLDTPRTELLTSIMKQTRTGHKRLRGMLPPGTVVGHKTGTGASFAHDVGFIELPDGRDLVIAVYTNSGLSVPMREEVIAQISRAAYDYARYAH